ncbi:MAG: LPS biosynthesis glycosyltransferase [Phormidesmis sp. RL_2_1]|nr:LPS biosynthesis glycosyltransferase [Phormidesmis sp. RL_2_1]
MGQTFVIAYKEVTEQLTTALTQAGCDCTVLRQVHQPGYETYSPSFLCLLNHRSAWELALRSQQPTLIVEADFVPVKNFAKLPPPFDPTDDALGIAWLYTCAAQVYSLSDLPQGSFAQGYSTSMVAYVITAKSARLLIELAAEVEKAPGPRAYSPWDSGIEYYLRDRKFHNYVPFRNYGEHGGRPNPEHGQNRLSKAHRADVLYGSLAFAPLYASADGGGTRWQWLKGRAYGRIKGLARLLLLKYLRPEVVKKSDHGGRLIKWAIVRQMTL